MKLRNIKELFNGRFHNPDGDMGLNMDELKNYLSNQEDEILKNNSAENLENLQKIKSLNPNSPYEIKHQLFEGLTKEKHYFDLIHKDPKNSIKKNMTLSYVVENGQDHF